MTSVDPYGGNPFRVLGVGSNASGKEAASGADRLLKWIELGELPQVEIFFRILIRFTATENKSRRPPKRSKTPGLESALNCTAES